MRSRTPADVRAARDAAATTTPLARGHRACPVCAGAYTPVLHAERFVVPDGHPLGHGYDVVWCASCGFVFADTVVAQSAYDRFYATLSKYSDETTGTGGGHQAWDDRRLETMARAISAAVPDRDARIVEIGCANGGLLRWLATLGYRDLHGVDPAPACAARTDALPGVHGYVGTLFDLPARTRDADCVIVAHVLEHVADVLGALMALRGIMRPDAVLYVEVPDATRYTEFVVAPFQDFNTEHINHFGPTSLRNALAAAGFRVRETTRKDIEASAGVPYPALYALATPGDGLGSVAQDTELRPAIERYVDRSALIMVRMAERIEGWVRRTPRLVVWGVGQTTYKLLARTALVRADIAAFIDTSATYRGMRLRGVEIVGPERLPEFPYPVLVGSLVNRDSIVATIAATGARNPLLLLDTSDSTPAA